MDVLSKVMSCCNEMPGPSQRSIIEIPRDREIEEEEEWNNDAKRRRDVTLLYSAKNKLRMHRLWRFIFKANPLAYILTFEGVLMSRDGF